MYLGAFVAIGIIAFENEMCDSKRGERRLKRQPLK
jgi:hypothetical protein